MDSCIFCKIINNTLPAFKIYEDESYLAILDLSQFTKGHTIVIPKKHVEFVWDAIDSGEYFAFTTKIANHFRKRGYKYVDSITFGRKVPHAHIHLIPHNGDSVDYQKAVEGFGLMQSDANRRLTKEDMMKIQNELKI